jgi:hypothetical protein
MMEQITSTRTVHTVSQFLDWQRSGVLQLSPDFQRRAVWKASAKSYLVDSVVRGYPLPVILLRQVQDIETLKLKMEVVDGQQRLRTLLTFIDPSSLPDFDDTADSFRISKNHNHDLAGKRFSDLPGEIRHRILSYEISTHVFPASTGDTEIYKIFARLNSTGLSLKAQEVRNSEYHGEFKSLVYDIAFSSIDYWKRWRVFTSSAIARMDEAEMISDLLITMKEGIRAKDQKYISSYYETYDEEDSYPGCVFAQRRLENVLLTIDTKLGEIISDTAFSRPALFFSLFAAIYDHMYGLGSPFNKKKAASLPSNIPTLLTSLSGRIRAGRLSEKVQDAIVKATADKARRDTRHKFLMKALDLEPAQ